MNPRALLGVAILLLVGVGGVIGYMEWEKRNKPPAPIAPPPPPPPPPPPDPEEVAKQEAAKKYEEITVKLKETPEEKKLTVDTAELHLRRAQAIFAAKEAIPLKPEERCQIAIGDVYQVLSLKLESEEAYDAVLLATIWVEALSFKREEKDQAMTRCLSTLDIACGEGKPAHKARIDYVRWRLKRPWAPDPKPLHERMLESFDVVLKTAPTADLAEEAGDVAKLYGKLNKAATFWRQAIELDPSRKTRLEKRINE